MENSETPEAAPLPKFSSQQLPMTERLALAREKLHSEKVGLIETGVANLRAIFQKQRPAQEVIDSKVCPRLIALLAHDSNHIQFCSLRALTTLTSEDHSLVEHLVLNGYVQALIKIAAQGKSRLGLLEDMCWSLGNISGDCHAYRDMVLDQGGLTYVVQLLEQRSVIPLPIIKIAAWALSNFCRGKPAFSKVKAALPVAASLTQHEDKAILVDALWSLSYLSDGDDTNVNTVSQYPDILPVLLAYLKSSDVQVLLPALRTVGNLTTGGDLPTQTVIDAGALPILRPLLFSTRGNVLKEAAWCMSNIMAGTAPQIRACLDADLIKPIIDLCFDARDSVRREALWAIINAFAGASHRDVHALVWMPRTLSIVADVLTSDETSLIALAIRVLNRIIQHGYVLAQASDDLTNPMVELMWSHDVPQAIEKYIQSGRSPVTLANQVLRACFQSHLPVLYPDN